MALITGRQLISLRLQEMPALDQLFTTVENYPNMTMEYLLVSFVGLSVCIAPPSRVSLRSALLATRGPGRSRADRFRHHPFVTVQFSNETDYPLAAPFSSRRLARLCAMFTP